MKRLAAMALAAALFGGCAVGPNYRRPPLAVPEQTRGALGPAEAASLADAAWWEIFRDEALTGLVDEALKNGYDVRLAAARVEEARANAGIARSEFFPQVQIQGQWTRSRSSQFLDPGSTPINLYDVNLGASWELDLWGRIRRLDEGALARYLSSEEARRGVLLSLVAEVATDYFQLRALDEQIAIARRTAGAFQETDDLFRLRLQGGVASALETASAEASVASTRAAIPNLERQATALENRLALLAGRNPGEIARGLALDSQTLPPEIPPGIPADLLQRRPDLRQAEQDLIAANADVGVAVADFFPRLSLTGAYGGVAPKISDLLQSGKAWSVGGGLLSPILQGRKLHNEYRAAVARYEQAKAIFEQKVTNAFGEVSTALTAYQKLAEAETEQAKSVAAYRDAVKLSNERYRAGLSDYLEVLQAQQQLFPAENALVQIRFNRLASLVDLYRALGGGWNLKDPSWVSPAAPPEASRPAAGSPR